MPELPEVETIVRALRQGGRNGPSILGRMVEGAQVFWDKSVAAPGAEEFIRRSAGQTVQSVGRRGKFIVIALQPDTLLVHLRMSGDLRVEAVLDEQGQPAASLAHDRLLLNLSGGMRLVFNDARKFGRAWLLDEPQQVLEKLGPEPLDEGFAPTDLYQRLQNTHRRLKPLLLDQTFVAGLGNIYTDESLHLARLHPNRLSHSLTLTEAERLWSAIRLTLQEGIDRNGASIDCVYRGGSFQIRFRVYQRTGEPCPVCGAPVIRTLVGQRGTHFCPVCQLES